MALSPEFSLLHSELNDFLFAQIGEEESGAPLRNSGLDAEFPALESATALRSPRPETRQEPSQ